MQTIEGTIILKIIKASLARDTEILGKMAPYCEIFVNNIKSKTTAKKNYGKSPEWLETFSFRAKIGDVVFLKVWDKDSVSSDDLVGEGNFTLSKDQVNMKHCFWVPLKFKNANGGQIQVDLEFIPNNESINILLSMLEKDFKEKVTLLNVYEENPAAASQIDVAMLSSKEETKSKIKEINDQIAQLNVEFQTKKNEIEKQTEENSKMNDQLKIEFNNLKNQLATYNDGTLKGLLKINLLDGTFTRDVGGVFDKMDPFVLFNLGSNTVQSNVKNNSGKSANWNQNLSLQRTSQDELGIAVLDHQDSLNHRTIGYTFVSIKKCLFSKEPLKFSNLALYYQGEVAGEINLEIQFEPDL